MSNNSTKDLGEEINKVEEDLNNESTETTTVTTPDISSTPASDISKKDLKKLEKEKEKRLKEELKQKEKEEKEKLKEDKEKQRIREKEEKDKLKEDKKQKQQVLSPKQTPKSVQKSFSQDNLVQQQKPSSPLTLVPPTTTTTSETTPSTPTSTPTPTTSILETTIAVENTDLGNKDIDTTAGEIKSPSPLPPQVIESDNTSSPSTPTPSSKSSSNNSKEVVIKVTRAFAAVVHVNVLQEDGENKMRNKVINELINTERDYITDLNVIINFIYQPLKESKLITDKDQSIIFSNIQLLLNVNKEFLIDIEKAANETQGNSIGPCFKYFSDYLKIYSSYCANQKTSSDHLAHCSKKFPQFKQFLDEKHQSPECRQCPLDSFLIKPIQRLCKYPLLLRELIKNSVSTHPDIVSLEEAYSKIQTVVLSVNESKRKAEVLQKMYKIHEQLETTEKFDFLTPTRYLIREDTLRELTEEKDKVSGKMHYYLFNDIIMRCKKDKKSIKLETLFLIASTKVISEENRQSTFCNTFELQQLGSAGRKFTLVCDSYEQKMEWINDIEELIRPFEEQSMREYEKLLDETFLYKRSTIATTTPSTTTTPDSPKQLSRSVTASTLQTKSQLSKPLPPPPPKAKETLVSSPTPTVTVEVEDKPTPSTFKKRPLPPPSSSSSPQQTNSNNNNVTIDLSNITSNITPQVIPVINKPKPVGRRVTSTIIDQNTNSNSITETSTTTTTNRASLQVQNTSSSAEPNKYQFQPIVKTNSNPSLVNQQNQQQPSDNNPTTPVVKSSGRPLPVPKSPQDTTTPQTPVQPSISKQVSSPTLNNIKPLPQTQSPTTETPTTTETVRPIQKFPSMASLKSFAPTSNSNRASVSTFTPSKVRETMLEEQQTTKDDLATLKTTHSSSPPPIPPPKSSRIMPLPPIVTVGGSSSPLSSPVSINTPVPPNSDRQIPKPLPTIPPVVPPTLPKRNSMIPK